jgi:hypothetical protein
MKTNLHQKALLVSKKYKQAEADLLCVLQEVDEARLYLQFQCPSLFSYCVSLLGLSESVASNFIAVARKAKEVPLLQEAILNGDIGVSKARKLTPVIKESNSQEWINQAKNLSQRSLEAEVAKVCPRAETKPKLKPVSESRSELKLGISKELEAKIRRIQDLESQRLKKAVSFEEALLAMAEIYLEKKDPVVKAERILTKKESVSLKHVARHTEDIPARVRHEVHARDQGQCTHVTNGKRCEGKRWIDIHHIKPRSEGGEHTIANLRTLCSAHHRMEHAQFL